jgi:hypothetical protein
MRALLGFGGRGWCQKTPKGKLTPLPELDAQDDQEYESKARLWRQSRAMHSYNGFDDLPGS